MPENVPAPTEENEEHGEDEQVPANYPPLNDGPPTSRYGRVLKKTDFYKA